jgi:hypothetical protein
MPYSPRPSCSSLAVTPDSSRIVTGSDDHTARVWDAHTGAELFKLVGHADSVRAIAVTPDGTRIVTGSRDGTARVWDAQTGAELLVFKGHTDSVLAVTVAPDSRRIVTGSKDNTARIWDIGTGAEIVVLKGHDSSVLAVAVTPDGSLWRQDRAAVGCRHWRRAPLVSCGRRTGSPGWGGPPQGELMQQNRGFLEGEVRAGRSAIGGRGRRERASLSAVAMSALGVRRHKRGSWSGRF